ncbi:MAG: hypothetical protein D6729_11410, partial [Deltaproteobacteria bacterium]
MRDAYELEEVFAPVAPGLEAAAAEDLKAAGLSGVRVVEGGVAVEGGFDAGLRACLWSRIATTVRLKIARFRAEDRDELALGLAQVRWDPYLTEETPVQAVARRSKIHHTGQIEEAVRRAAGRALPRGSGGVLVRVVAGVAEVSIDLAGVRLHRRGWRKEGGRAPLRETLAAGILHLAGYRPG